MRPRTRTPRPLPSSFHARTVRTNAARAAGGSLYNATESQSHIQFPLVRAWLAARVVNTYVYRPPRVRATAFSAANRRRRRAAAGLFLPRLRALVGDFTCPRAGERERGCGWMERKREFARPAGASPPLDLRS